MNTKFNSQHGQASRLLLVLAVVVLVAVVITFLVIRMADKPPKPVSPDDNPVPLPVYETTLNNIRFIFQSALDRGSILRASEANSAFRVTKDSTATPGGKFIMVTTAAQNMGTITTLQRAWEMGNIIDSEGRNFVPVDGRVTEPWLPVNNSCEVPLKPAFDPSPCTKIYEISKISTGLKVQILSGKASFLMDLIVK